jgi:hypothetical protein
MTTLKMEAARSSETVHGTTIQDIMNYRHNVRRTLHYKSEFFSQCIKLSSESFKRTTDDRCGCIAMA